MVTELYKKYCQEGFDQKGILNIFKPLPSENFNFAYDVVDAIAAEEPGRTAVVWCNENGEEKILSFGEISCLSNQVANTLTKDGIKKGDKVLLILKRHYQFWYILPALHKIGAVAIPATNLLTKKDLEYRFDAASVSTVICTAEGDASKNIDDAILVSPTVLRKYTVNGAVEGFDDLDEKIKTAEETFERIENSWRDPLMLYFTSGTTGLPKMVLHNHSYAISHIVTAKYWHNVDPNGVHFTVAETGWAKAVWGKVYGQWFVGAAVFVYDFGKFVPSDLLNLIEKYKITTFCAPPTIYRFMIKEDLSKYNLSSLSYATTAGEAVNPEVFKQFYAATGLTLMEGFGQTETVLQAANLVGSTPKAGSMGKPSPLYDILLVNEEGKPVPTGEIGEIVVVAEQGETMGMFDGYYLAEDLTKSTWYEGLYHTGDTAWRDEDGYLWYVGRTDDIIKASGYRIGPFEIESVLMEHSAVLECAVTGAADPVRGTVVKATIVLARGYNASDELACEIQEYVKSQTAPYKYPRVVEFVEELPKTISGKIRRVELREKK